MRNIVRWSAGCLCVLVSVGALAAQQPTAPMTTSVPRVIRVTGTLGPMNGVPVPVEVITFSIYPNETGGTALWQETQQVAIENGGQYSVLLGGATAEGLPGDLFASGDARWLAMRVERPDATAPARVRLTSVPYALRAADADTLGGRPASAYLLAPGVDRTADARAAVESGGGTADLVLPGTPNYLAKYVNGADVGSSGVFEAAGGAIGMGTTTPFDRLHIRYNNNTGDFTGLAVQNTNPGALAYSGMLFYDHSGALTLFQGYNNSTHEYRINNIAPGGSINFMIGSSSKFLVANNGNVSVIGNVNLGTSTSGTTGNITKNGVRFLHDFGFQNTFVGVGSGNFTMSGQGNTGVGTEVFPNNIQGSGNVAFGSWALRFNTAGSSNSAVGYGALQNNTTAGDNSAFGSFALGNNVDGSGNSAVGFGALNHNVSGSHNTAVGEFALGGVPPLGGGSDNVAIGYAAGSFSDGSNDIYIGASVNGPSGESNVIRIGNGQLKTYIAGIRGITTGAANAIPVMIDSTGQLGTVSSSRRYKEDIRDMGDASRALFALRPVTFRYTKPYTDGTKPLQYGLVAEEVAEVFPNLVVKNADGGVDTVHYETLSVLLLNELKRQQLQIEALEQQLQQLRTAVNRSGR